MLLLGIILLILQLCQSAFVTYAILAASEIRIKFIYFQLQSLHIQGVQRTRIKIYARHDTSLQAALYSAFPYATINHIPNRLAGQKNPERTIFHKTLDMNWNYEQMLQHVFNSSEYVVVLEDDLLLGADAHRYFVWGSQLMEHDKTVFSVSGHNINAMPALSIDPTVIYRENTFGGLGWLTSRYQFQNFIRVQLNQNRGRLKPWDVCIADNVGNRDTVYPEVPRTLHVSDHSGRNAELFGLAFNLRATPPLPPIESMTATRYDRKIQSMLHQACREIGTQTRVVVVPSGKEKAWEQAYASVYGKNFFARLRLYSWGIGNKPKGYRDGLVVTRDLDGHTLIFMETHSKWAQFCSPMSVLSH